MKILSLDSTAKTATAALCEDETLLAEYTLNNGNTHSESLLPMVESILSAFSLKPHDVELFACAAGPGSFTGVRIGVATVKGLAFGSGRPAVGVSTLEALARNLDFGDTAGAGTALAAHVGLEVGHSRLFCLGRGSFPPQL